MPRWRVRFEPSGQELEVDAAQDILAAARAAGLDLPWSCLEGSCTTCTGRLLEGEVEQDRAMALRDAEKEAGFVLLCVAHPMRDCVVRTHCADDLDDA